jgi:hypothetical protein
LFRRRGNLGHFPRTGLIQEEPLFVEQWEFTRDAPCNRDDVDWLFSKVIGRDDELMRNGEKTRREEEFFSRSRRVFAPAPLPEDHPEKLKN